MMATWVLIVFIKSGYAGGAFSQEFSSLDKCEAALELTMDHLDFGFGGATAFCVEK